MKLTKALKFRVLSPEHSKAIQARLSELGASWFKGDFPQYTHKQYLYVQENGHMQHGTDSVAFGVSHEKEATLDDLYNPTLLTPSCQAKSVVIDGKKYKLVLDE